MSSHDIILAQSQAPVVLEDANARSPTRVTWFKSDPVNRNFCDRVIGLQLVTKSRDQGWVSRPEDGSWSWFELSIFPNSKTNVARNMDNTPLSWRSHNNQMASRSTRTERGLVFDLYNSKLLTSLKVR